MTTGQHMAWSTDRTVAKIKRQKMSLSWLPNLLARPLAYSVLRLVRPVRRDVEGVGYACPEHLSNKAITYAVLRILKREVRESSQQGWQLPGANSMGSDSVRNRPWRWCAVCSYIAMTFNCALGGLLHVQPVERHHHRPLLAAEKCTRPA